MASPGTAPITITLEPSAGTGATPALLAAMLRANERVSDLIFSPGRPPQIEVLGELIPVTAPGLRAMTADDTRRIASDLIGNNKQAITSLREQGSCDISYGLPGLARFRVNVFIQRGSCAVVMRAIPTTIPSFEGLGLPMHMAEIAGLSEGLVLVAGPRGSGKSSTLAALLDCINEKQNCHILTIEDPIEFLHNHKRSTVHQREMHSDASNFAQALRSALRQAPKVIMVGELRDRETMEMMMEAAETGHLVLSSLNSADVSKAVERMVSAFAPAEQAAVRNRLAKTLRWIVAQRLIPRKDGSGRVAAFEILKVNAQAMQCLETYDHSGQALLKIMKEGRDEGMQHFDGEIGRLVERGWVDVGVAMRHATNAEELRRAAAG
ncbi:MAG: PilT/PilU family type 4a pilus ATPase [Terriglobales bacterium]|jgi:twitching motility protein PilT